MIVTVETNANTYTVEYDRDDVGMIRISEVTDSLKRPVEVSAEFKAELHRLINDKYTHENNINKH